MSRRAEERALAIHGLAGCRTCGCTGCGMCIRDDYSDEACDCTWEPGCQVCGCTGCAGCTSELFDVCGCG